MLLYSMIQDPSYNIYIVTLKNFGNIYNSSLYSYVIGGWASTIADAWHYARGIAEKELLRKLEA